MTIDELMEFSVQERKRLRKVHPIKDIEKEIFARMTKIMEELGELCEAVLSFYSLQRKDKEKKSKEDVEKEIADTVIGLFILAHQMDIDIKKALKKKVDIIKARKY